MEIAIKGLSSQEVMRRKADDKTGNRRLPLTRTKAAIFQENIFTLFNMLNFTIALLLLAVGAYANMTFILIILLNIAIGIAQELKAKKLVDELAILNKPKAKALRDGAEFVLEMEELVKDDVIVLTSGQQICNDSIVLSGTVEVNEALLTGESDAVVKTNGAELYSGSFVMAGKCYARVTHVGRANYAMQLTEEAKKTKQLTSELLSSMRYVTRLTSFLIVPLGVLLFSQAVLLRQTLPATAIVTTAAALLGMLPKGLVLLIAVALANGVIRLAKLKILVQNIYSLETLAHVDVLCLDKTGTITDGKLKVKNALILRAEQAQDMLPLLQAYLAASDDNNATFQALQEHFGAAATAQPLVKIAFSSLRKWGAVSFASGTIFIGAVEKILKGWPAVVEQHIEQGYRTVGIGFYRGIWRNNSKLPTNIEPLYAVIMQDRLRANVAATLEYFRQEGVEVKIISGDHLKTVTMIARKAGLKNWEQAVDMSALGEQPAYDSLCQYYSVFARVTPQQKQLLVKALRRQGHHVAMTGDGVNDLLALREADCSIAIAEGSDASRQISQIVLLDSDFTHLPSVVLEGRKVIHNITRTASVFFIKTIYSLLLSFFCLFLNMPFPFIPLQITLVDALIEAYPAFFTMLEADTRALRSSFLKTALGSAAPFALAITVGIVFLNYSVLLTGQERRTLMYLLLMGISMLAVFKSCLPFTKLRAFICSTMVLGAWGFFRLVPQLFALAAFTTLMQAYLVTTFAVLTIIVIMFFCMKKALDLSLSK